MDRGSKKLRILDMILRSPRGVTADELELRTGYKASTVSSTLCGMVKDKMIVYTNETRKTRSGRDARVYVRRKR